MKRVFDLQQILRPVDEPLQRVTDRLMVCLQNPVARMVAYLIVAGGKRLRPALVLLAGKSGPRRDRQRSLVDLATAVELIHTATLIHDDIIDRSTLRRKQPTFHQRFGTERAVLMGDYLYANAFAILAGIRQAYVTRHLAEICQQMSRGEFSEVESRYNLSLTEAEYLQIVKDKTASLIAASCHLGAYLGGAKPQTIGRITDFGWNLGMAFQIMDDCLDLIGEEKLLGKSLRSDLDKGLLSLPIIYLAGSLSRQERDTLLAPLRRQAQDRAFLAKIARQARKSGAISRALSRAEQFVQAATGAVAIQDGVALPETYRQLARYAIARTQ